LLAQLILQDAINQLAKNDEELDQSFLSKVLLLVAITAEKMIEDDESGAVTRLKLRSQKLRGMRSFRFLEIWELQYLLGMGTGLPKEQLTMRLADVVGWLEGTTNKTLDFIVESEPEAMKNQESDQLSFGFIDHNASSIQGPKKK
jgi:hypothetical protein